MRTPIISHSSPYASSSSPSSRPSSSSTRRSPYAVKRTLLKRVPPSKMPSSNSLASKTFLPLEVDYTEGSICDVCGSQDGSTLVEEGSGNRLCEDCWEESKQTQAAELNDERTVENESWEESSDDEDQDGGVEEEMNENNYEYEIEEPEEEDDDDDDDDISEDSMCPDFAHRSVIALELGRAAQDQEELRLNKELLDAFSNTEVNRDLLTEMCIKNVKEEDEEGEEPKAQSISFSTEGLVRFFDSAASMADTHIHSLPLEIKAFDGQSSHQANYIGSTTMEEDDDDEPMMEDDCEEEEEEVKEDDEGEDDSPSTAESDGKADDDEEDDEDWETSSLAEYTTEELSYIRDLMAMPRGALSEL